MFISSMQAPVPSAKDTLMLQPALLFALQSASFRDNKKTNQLNKKRKAELHPLFIVPSYLVIDNPALFAGFPGKRLYYLMFWIYLILFECFSVNKFTIQYHISRTVSTAEI